ncbi:MAG: NAD-dependent DNA ligase LigA [Phycisphaerales bacterium]|nr:NAD-dependent DNA ligase LigA [Phycisphaerales bacterium]
MSNSSATEQEFALKQLRDAIRRHDELYYLHAKPEISDHDYDSLMRKLLELEAQHPELVTPDSPSQRVGGKPVEGFASVRHNVRMMSIDNTYDEGEVRDFDTRAKKLLEGKKVRYTCEPKIDGVSLSLRYEDGLLITAVTRGDGVSGDDVTANAKTIRNIPLRLRSQKPEARSQEEKGLFDAAESEAKLKSVVEVRGEVFISRAQFARINQQREEEGLETYANPRNTTAGTLKQLDSKVVAARKLEFLPHGVGEIKGREGGDVKNNQEWQEKLRAFGFRTNEPFAVCETIDDVLRYIHEFATVRACLPFDTDGVVIKCDDFQQREALGATGKSPRWCIAYKYQPEQAETELARVVCQVGKTGTITPVAEFEPPVFISGTKVSRASLHNFDEVERKDLYLHDRVLVEKAGEVIPYVVGVVKEKRPTHAEKILRPEQCPSCQTKDLKHEGGFVRCTNPNCPAQLQERVKFWAGRHQMDIEELGEAIIAALIKAELLTSLPDIYRLRKEEIVPLVVSRYEKPKSKKKSDGLWGEGEEIVEVTIGDKRADNLLRGIEKSKGRGLAKLLSALGIPTIGRQTADVLASHFRSLSPLRAANFDAIVRSLEKKNKKDSFLSEVEGLREDYPICQQLTNEQIFDLQAIPQALLNEIQETPPNSRNKSSPWQKIITLRNFGVTAVSLYRFLHSATGEKMLDELEALGLKTAEDPPPSSTHRAPGLLTGKSIVVTGTLTHFSREEIQARIEALGGKASDSVTSKTSFVIFGENAGSKLQKAQQLGIETIDEAEFMRRIGQNKNE